jgi:hypothetical protein
MFTAANHLRSEYSLTAQSKQDIESLLRRASRLHRFGSLDDPTDLEYTSKRDDLELKLGDVIEAADQAVALLPYIPNIYIKLGTFGVLSVRLDQSPSAGLRFGDFVVQHHPGSPQKAIVSVTGAG